MKLRGTLLSIWLIGTAVEMASCYGWSSIKQNLNAEPIFFFEETVILPPKASAICLEMTRPSPIPETLTPLVPSRHPKSLNSFCLSSWVIPIPLSITETTILGFYSIKSIGWTSGSLSRLVISQPTSSSHACLSSRYLSVTSWWPGMCWISTFTPALIVNLMALDSMFKSTYWKRRESDFTCSSVLKNSTSRSMFFLTAACS